MWVAYDFSTRTAVPEGCDDARYIRRDIRQGQWVGAVLCGSDTRYKLYMGTAANDPFFELADYGGHGQDHCELVNLEFRIDDDDDIRSGGCTECDIGPQIEPSNDAPVFVRTRFGERFEYAQAGSWGGLSAAWYECGVAIPGPALPRFRWEISQFETAGGVRFCDGRRYVRYDEVYDKWVGAESCADGTYKLYMSETRDGVYYQIVDMYGSGEDQCELVVPEFDLQDDLDLLSGTCTGCLLGGRIDFAGVPAYGRDIVGNDFVFLDAARAGDVTTPWMWCGRTIP